MSDAPPNDQVQYEDVYAEVPQWPRVVGIISIVWAVLGLCCTGWGIFNMIRGVPSGTGQGEMPPELAQAMEAQQRSALSLVGFALGSISVFTLLVAGILTVTRKPAGRPAHLAYAVLSLIQFGIAVVGMNETVRIMRDWGAQNPGHEFTKALGIVVGFMKVVMVLVGVVGAGYPIFLLVWFGLVKRTPESMTGLPGVEPADKPVV